MKNCVFHCSPTSMKNLVFHPSQTSMSVENQTFSFPPTFTVKTWVFQHSLISMLSQTLMLLVLNQLFQHSPTFPLNNQIFLQFPTLWNNSHHFLTLMWALSRWPLIFLHSQISLIRNPLDSHYSPTWKSTLQSNIPICYHWPTQLKLALKFHPYPTSNLLPPSLIQECSTWLCSIGVSYPFLPLHSTQAWKYQKNVLGQWPLYCHYLKQKNSAQLSSNHKNTQQATPPIQKEEVGLKHCQLGDICEVHPKYFWVSLFYPCLSKF